MYALRCQTLTVFSHKYVSCVPVSITVLLRQGPDKSTSLETRENAKEFAQMSLMYFTTRPTPLPTQIKTQATLRSMYLIDTHLRAPVLFLRQRKCGRRTPSSNSVPSGFLIMKTAPAATTKTLYFAPSRANARNCPVLIPFSSFAL